MVFFHITRNDVFPQNVMVVKIIHFVIQQLCKSYSTTSKVSNNFHLDGTGSFEKEDIEEIEKLMALIDVNRQIDR